LLGAHRPPTAHTANHHRDNSRTLGLAATQQRSAPTTHHHATPLHDQNASKAKCQGREDGPSEDPPACHRTPVHLTCEGDGVPFHQEKEAPAASYPPTHPPPPIPTISRLALTCHIPNSTRTRPYASKKQTAQFAQRRGFFMDAPGILRLPHCNATVQDEYGPLKIDHSYCTPPPQAKTHSAPIGRTQRPTPLPDNQTYTDLTVLDNDPSPGIPALESATRGCCALESNSLNTRPNGHTAGPRPPVASPTD